MATASWIFGSLVVVFIMAVVAYRVLGHGEKNIDRTTHTLLGFLCAILAGLFAFFFTGTVAANVAPSASQLGSLGVQATGGAALFVIVLWWWRSESSPISAEDRTMLRVMARVFQNIDKAYPELREVARPGEKVSASYRVTAAEEGNAIVFRDRNQPTPIMHITKDDIDALPAEDREFIRVREKSMSNLLKEWSKVYPERLAGSPKTQANAKIRLRELAIEICRDLNGILNHLGYIGRQLEDHYGAARTICAEIENPASGT
jgi:hypothetical protein